MYQTSKRMKAFAYTLEKLTIHVSKSYYGGQIDTFYIHQKSSKEVTTLVCKQVGEDGDWIYYEAVYPMLITNIYDVIDQYGLTVVVSYQPLVNDPHFDTIFYYEGNDLGCQYTKTKTTWKVWAPTALSMLLQLHSNSQIVGYEMEKTAAGVFTISLEGDYDGLEYTYLVNHEGMYKEALDPYSYSSTSNNQASIVIDLKKCNNNTGKKFLPKFTKKTDAIIYEMSVRDFTMDSSIQAQQPGLFLGAIEKGLQTKKQHPAGLEYLQYLGVTHVQLMPIYDFATVEENNPKLYYNWGYDPMQYNVPEGSYATDSDNAYTRILECQAMISGLHHAGIRVIMDVVYNHMYDEDQCAYETLVPGYFLRRNQEGYLSNGSWCGNDLHTQAKMVRKYLVDISMRYQQVYGIDGLRFDLMGLLDIETLQRIYYSCYQQDHAFLMYGEGWNMDTALAVEQRGIQENHEALIEIGFFNDYFRDKMKGKSDAHSLGDRGYFAGNMYNSEDVCRSLLNTHRYSRVDQSINYVECHDNATTYDKYAISNSEETEEVRNKRQKLLTMSSILAQGIPFIHAGQEWYRTKQGVTNSYCASDAINQIDWTRVDQHWQDINDIRKIIAFRKENLTLFPISKVEVEQVVEVAVIHNEVIQYTLTSIGETKVQYSIYINASTNSHTVSLPTDYEIIFDSEKRKEIVEIVPLSMVILKVR